MLGRPLTLASNKYLSPTDLYIDFTASRHNSVMSYTMMGDTISIETCRAWSFLMLPSLSIVHKAMEYPEP